MIIERIAVIPVPAARASKHPVFRSGSRPAGSPRLELCSRRPRGEGLRRSKALIGGPGFVRVELSPRCGLLRPSLLITCRTGADPTGGFLDGGCAVVGVDNDFPRLGVGNAGVSRSPAGRPLRSARQVKQQSGMGHHLLQGAGIIVKIVLKNVLATLGGSVQIILCLRHLAARIKSPLCPRHLAIAGCAFAPRHRGGRRGFLRATVRLGAADTGLPFLAQ